MESLSMNGIGKTLSSRSGNPTENFELLIIIIIPPNAIN